MKFKKLHMIGTLLAGGVAIATLSSYENGTNLTGRSVSGCGGSGCHGTQDAATQINVIGFPTAWAAGHTYPITLKVTNASEAKAGFDLAVSAGTISGGSTGTALTGNMEIHHNTPQTLSSGTATWTFNWTAPTTGSAAISVNVACNAVNGNGVQDAADHWNTASLSMTAGPNSIASLTEGGFSVYPNPVKDQMVLTAKSGADVAVSAVTTGGSFIVLQPVRLADGKYQINTSGLAAGMYVLMLQAEGKSYATRFVKL